MRFSSVALAAALLAGVGAQAQAQDARGVLDTLNRAINPQQQDQGLSERERERIRAEEERYWRDYYGNRSDWRERSQRDFGYDSRGGESRASLRDDRDLDRVFRSDGARRLEYERLSDSERRRYDEASPGERRRMDDDLARDARDRWQRLSENDRRRYLDDVERADRRYSGSSSSDRDRSYDRSGSSYDRRR